MHRLIVNAPPGVQVDHVNGDGLDNRRANLRLASATQNAHNRKIRRDNTSGFKGVRFDQSSQRWDARITFQGKRYYLGLFVTAELAARTYDQAARRLFGDFARTNLCRLYPYTSVATARTAEQLNEALRLVAALTKQ
ncbi:MAG: HNH endonuclease [Verrucomicrobia bacterium]|nr:HNH endonuclease [Verrucomicrobiota bacterium]